MRLGSRLVRTQMNWGGHSPQLLMPFALCAAHDPEPRQGGGYANRARRWSAHDIAGLWDQWRNPKGEWVYYCTTLTFGRLLRFESASVPSVRPAAHAFAGLAGLAAALAAACS